LACCYVLDSVNGLHLDVNLKSSSDLKWNSRPLQLKFWFIYSIDWLIYSKSKLSFCFYRFEVDVKFVQFFLRIQTFDLILKERIGQVVMWEGYECGRTETTGGWVGYTRWIANASRTETPIVRVLVGTAKHFLCPCVSIECDTIFDDIFRIVDINWSANLFLI